MSKLPKTPVVLAFAAVLALVLAVASPILSQSIPFSKLKLSELAMLGDWLGGVTGPLLNVSATLLLLSALLYQRSEAKDNRMELVEQRHESFFNALISAHRSRVLEIKLINSMGTEAFEAFTKGVETSYNKHRNQNEAGTLVNSNNEFITFSEKELFASYTISNWFKTHERESTLIQHYYEFTCYIADRINVANCSTELRSIWLEFLKTSLTKGEIDTMKLWEQYTDSNRLAHLCLA